jgi:bifunctional DNase/RNase
MKRCMLCYLALLLSVSVSLPGSLSQSPNEDVLEMKVKGVTMDPQGNTPIVILEDLQGRRAFPIWVGLPEARAILLALEGVATPRPLTHVLLHKILTDLTVEVVRITITDMHDNTFYATILLRQSNKTFTIDARPSDAIALALQAKAPVFATRKLLEAVRTVTLQEPTAPPLPTKTLGMHVQGLDMTLASFFHLPHSNGVLVSAVEAGGQAERHGMRRGDVITGVDGQSISGLQEFLTLCKGKKVGQELVLQITRDQQPLVIRLLLSALDEETPGRRP